MLAPKLQDIVWKHSSRSTVSKKIYGNFSKTLRSVKKLYAEAFPELYRTFKMVLFIKMVTGFQPLTIFAKSSILDVWQASAYVSALKGCKNVMYIFIFSMLHIFSKNPSIKVQVLFHKKKFYKEMSLKNPKTLRKCWEHLFFFLFYLRFVSRTFTNHRTAREGGGHSINSSLPPPPASRTLRP